PPATPRRGSPPRSTPRRSTATCTAAAASPGCCASIFPIAKSKRLSRRSPSRKPAATRRSSRSPPMVPGRPGPSAGAPPRRGGRRAERGWRGGGRAAPGGGRELREAERKLAIALRDDYRRFLETPQRTELLVRLDDRIATLRFFAPGQLAKQRDALFRCITRTDKPAIAEASFRAQYGVALRRLVPI